VDNDPTDISCRLLGRLKMRLHEEGVRLLVLMLENGQSIVASDHPPLATAEVGACARKQGIQTVDAWDRLKPIASRSRQEFETLFVMGAGKDAFGHHSSAGNWLIAEVVASALASPH